MSKVTPADKKKSKRNIPVPLLTVSQEDYPWSFKQLIGMPKRLNKINLRFINSASLLVVLTLVVLFNSFSLIIYWDNYCLVWFGFMVYQQFLVSSTQPMKINGYAPFLILLYILPMNNNGYVPFLLLLYILPMNNNVYVPFLMLLYILPMNNNGYAPFLILLYILPMNNNGYVSFLINTLDTIVMLVNMLTK